MKIIIAGAGAVGTHLAQLLAKESQNITLIDESEDKLSKVADNVDLMTLNVKPTSISGLKEAGARTCRIVHRRHARRNEKYHLLHAGPYTGSAENSSPYRQCGILG